MNSTLKNTANCYCGKGIWNVLNSYVESSGPTKIFVLTDNNTKVNCLPLFLENFQSDLQVEVLEMPSGEEHKNIETCMRLWTELSDKGADRNSLLINLGGGVVTDLGGFVASTFKRGIAFVNIPTSLLAMVDASVGGKNGIDLGVLKNQVGVIRDAEKVLIDTEFLKTLPEAHFKSGMAEMLKHGLITSLEYWNSLDGLTVDSDKLEDLIWESVLIKAHIVSEDPFEKSVRKTLNFGHTLGHAIESYCLEQSHLPVLLHGEAIALGMILETYISTETLGFPIDLMRDIARKLNSIYRLGTFSSDDIEAIIRLLVFDKKTQGGRVMFVLLSEIGEASINHTVDNALIYKAFDYYHQ